ncbi:MAG: hypothetical protein M3301_10125 [Chloroflexota bacterium]|nr:hypothetical protein [Chloroflexota bacterium]
MTDSLSRREELIAAHAEAKRRRDAAPLGSDEFMHWAEEVARIEVEMAAAREAAQADPSKVTERRG